MMSNLTTVVITNSKILITDVIHQYVSIVLYDDVPQVHRVVAPPGIIRRRPQLMVTLKVVGIRERDAAVPEHHPGAVQHASGNAVVQVHVLNAVQWHGLWSFLGQENFMQFIDPPSRLVQFPKLVTSFHTHISYCMTQFILSICCPSHNIYLLLDKVRYVNQLVK